MRNLALRRSGVLVAGVLVVVLCMEAGLGNPTPTPAPDPSTKPVQKTAAGGAKYFVSLPKGWNAKQSWPILVNTNVACEVFGGARGELPFIIVSPCVVPGGRDPNDIPTLMACVQDAQKNFNGMPKFFITGYSTGGHLVWQMVLLHPEVLAGAAPAAGNYIGRGIDEAQISKAKERVDLPVHAFQGDKDANKGGERGLDVQWKNAEEIARAHGYTNLSRETVAGAGHVPFPREVMDYFVTVLKGGHAPAATSAPAGKTN